ncbi:MAG TPA: hypothetical protein VNA04_12355, partial [Thermoanaerobaculia bacterium]|nr:hypothetical protein [Thermoanaerobaculia bacterium]
RDWRDFYGFRVDTTTPVSTDFLGISRNVEVVENTNDIERTYRGVQFQSQWRPNLLRGLGLGLNYTWSELKGNDTQESSTSGTVGNDPGTIYYSEFLNYERRKPIGFLGGDQTHRARAWASYDFSLGPLGRLNTSLLHNYDSGSPYSLVGSVRVRGTGTGAPTTPHYINPPTTSTYYFSDRGEFRLEDVHRTDLALNYSFPIRRVALFAQAEMLNVLNNDTVTSINTTVTTAAQSSSFAAFNPFTTPRENLIECPQTASLAECRTMGAHFRKGTLWGQPTGPASYQLARTYRFNVGVRF